MVLLLVALYAGLSVGSAGGGLDWVWRSVFDAPEADSVRRIIIWQVRFPRVLMAALVGAALSLGGLVFQALLRNALAEPYILGVSGGSAIGAIIGILLGLSRFPGVSTTAFIGSLATLILILGMASGRTILKRDALLLSGVMVNAFCSAVIMFLISMAMDSRIHTIMFWLMGDFSAVENIQVGKFAAYLLPEALVSFMENFNVVHIGMLAVILAPCFVIIFCLANAMNLLLLGREMAQSMGINTRSVTLTLLIITSLMVSGTVSHCGLIGFVGLVIPHLLRMMFGPDHRVLVPACVLGGGAYMVACDILARSLPRQGEMPVGVVTAMIGAPLFIFLLKRSGR